MKTNTEVPQAEELRFLMKSLVRDGSEDLIGQTKDLTSSVESLKKKVTQAVEGYETLEASIGALQKRIQDLPEHIKEEIERVEGHIVAEARKHQEQIQAIETKIHLITAQLDEKHERLEKSVSLFSDNQAKNIDRVSEHQVKIQSRRMVVGFFILSIITLASSITMHFIK